MREFQYWGMLSDGELGFAGCQKLKAATTRAAKRIARDWHEWATRYVAENPGEYPTAAMVRRLPVNPIVEIRLHPVGHPELCKGFAV